MNISSSRKKKTVSRTSEINLNSRELAPISIEEARRIMGDASLDLSNDEVQNLIYDLTFIARDYIRSSKLKAIQHS